MKQTDPKHLLVLIAASIVALALVGCPKTVSDTGGEVMPPAEVGAPVGEESGPTIPESAANLGEALAGISFPSSYEMTIPAEEEPISFLMKMDGRKLVAYRMNSAEGSLITNLTEGFTYHYDAKTNEALKMVAEEDNGDVPNPYEFYGDDLKVTGSETIDGVECWVVEGTGGENAPGTMWVEKSTGLMRQAADGDDIIKFSYSRIGEIPDSEFSVPEGAKITDLTQVGQPPAGNQ